MKKNNFYEEINKLNMAPLWDVLSDLVTPEPKTKALPNIWYWNQVKSHVLNSSAIISAKEASALVFLFLFQNIV